MNDEKMEVTEAKEIKEINEINEVNDELLGKIEEAAQKGAEKGARKAGRKSSLISTLVIVAVLLGAGYFAYTKITDIFSIENLIGFENGIEEHDLALENHGFLGYTAADFQEAVLGDSQQLKKLEVYTTEISDVAEITDTGLANLKVFTKCQTITYNGYATYTVDLSKVNKDSILFDGDNKKITILIPHCKREEITIPSNEIEFGDTTRGLLAWGDIKMTAEESSKVQTAATEKMETKLEETGQADQADRFAKMSVWELYQPVITGVSPEFKLEVEFAD